MNTPLVQEVLQIYSLPIFADDYGMFVFDKNSNMMLDSAGHRREHEIMSLFVKSFNQVYGNIPAEFTDKEKEVLKQIKLPLLRESHSMCILDSDQILIARTRGWGKLLRYHNSEALQDTLQVMFIDAFNKVCGGIPDISEDEFDDEPRDLDSEYKCLVCGENFMPGENGNDLGFCEKCQKSEDFPYDIEAFYKDYDAGLIAHKGFETMSSGLLDKYETYPNYKE